MALAGGAVHGHHPQVALVLVLAREQNAVTLADGVEEEPAALQVCMACQVRSGQVRSGQGGKLSCERGHES